MPGFQDQLDKLRNSVVGEEDKRGVIAGPDEKTSFAAPSPGMGKRLTFRKEHDLTDSIEADYNPTEWPFSLRGDYNEIETDASEDALEWRGIGKREFTLSLFLTDFGYHRKKGPGEEVFNKLYWFEQCITKPVHQIVDGKAIKVPPIILISRGAEAYRCVVLKIEGTESYFDKTLYRPERATIAVTFREVRKPKPKAVRFG